MNNDTLQIRSFLDKVRVAKSANSKEIRVTIQEAEQLGIALGILLSKELDMANQIIELQSQIASAEVQQDGGGF